MVGAGFLPSCWAAKRSRCSPTAPSLSSCTAELAQGYLRHISPHLNWVFIETRMVWSDERRSYPLPPLIGGPACLAGMTWCCAGASNIPDRIGWMAYCGELGRAFRGTRRCLDLMVAFGPKQTCAVPSRLLMTLSRHRPAGKGIWQRKQERV